MDSTNRHTRHAAVLLWAIEQLGGQSATARACGVTHRAVRKWETAKRLPLREWHTPKMANRICEALAKRNHIVSVPMLLGDIPSGRQPSPNRESASELILNMLDGATPSTSREIALMSGKTRKQTWSLLNRLVKQGRISKFKENGVTYYSATNLTGREVAR